MSIATIAKTLRFVALPSEVADRIRQTLRDDFDHELTVTRTIAPCRSCLKISTVPEDLILFSYRPMEDAGPYAEVGPIFIHAARCERYAQEQTFPADFLERPLVLRAYDARGHIVDATVAAPHRAVEEATRLLEQAAVKEIHVRHISYTCFDFKIVRDS